jgi:tRNA threonylcarbamoyladenosine biosynthesis protein TsaE
VASDTFQFEAHDEAGTVAFGQALARALPARCVVGLNGTLGAGKTRLVQAVAEACGIQRRDVVSPTFVLVQEYHGRRSIYHVDAYRLRDEDEFLALGVDERFDEDVLVFIEWAERISGCLPRDRIEIRIGVVGDAQRRFEVRATSPSHLGVIQALKDELA